MTSESDTPGGSFTRPQFFDEQPRLRAADQQMVVGGDLDALQSAVFLHDRLDWEVVGFYTGFETVYYTDADALSDAVWVDLDVNHPSIESLGHHILRDTAEDDLDGLQRSCNLNEARGISRQSFTRKYPLGTIHFLCWLHDAAGFTPLQRAFLLSADSTWINGQTHNYGDNVREWVQHCLDLDWLVDALDDIQTEAFETTIREDVYPIIEETGFSHGGSSGWTTSRHFDLNGWQCSFDDPTTAEVQALVDRIAAVMGWDAFDVPANMQVERGSRHSIDYDTMTAEYGSLDDLLRETNAFSYAIPTRNSINYTTDIDVV
jgi:hypothetical protein